MEVNQNTRYCYCYEEKYITGKKDTTRNKSCHMKQSSLIHKYLAPVATILSENGMKFNSEQLGWA